MKWQIIFFMYLVNVENIYVAVKKKDIRKILIVIILVFLRYKVKLPLYGETSGSHAADGI